MLADELAIRAAGRDGAEELLAVELGATRVTGREDLLVVGELAVDQPGDEVDPVEVEQHLVAGLGEDELDGVVGVGQDPAQLRQGAGRDDD